MARGQKFNAEVIIGKLREASALVWFDYPPMTADDGRTT